jgi:hypothetical protein
MVTVDVGPLGGGNGGGAGEEAPSAKIYLNLPAEELDAAWAQSLNGQRPTLFPV